VTPGDQTGVIALTEPAYRSRTRLLANLSPFATDSSAILHHVFPSLRPRLFGLTGSLDDAGLST